MSFIFFSQTPCISPYNVYIHRLTRTMLTRNIFIIGSVQHCQQLRIHNANSATVIKRITVLRHSNKKKTNTMSNSTDSFQINKTNSTGNITGDICSYINYYKILTRSSTYIHFVMCSSNQRQVRFNRNRQTQLKIIEGIHERTEYVPKL